MKRLLLALTLIIPYFSFSQFAPPRELLTSGASLHLLTFDIDGDNMEDILNCDYLGELIWYKNAGDGSFVLPGTPLASGEMIVFLDTVDFNKDGWLDFIAVTNFDAILFRNDYGSFVPQTIMSVEQGQGFLSNASAGDFDADGDIDFFISIYQGPVSIFFVENTGHNSFARAVEWSRRYTFGTFLRTSDFNEDGLPDIALAHQDTLEILVNKGSMLFETMFVATGIYPDSTNIYIKDFDLDGDKDFIYWKSGNIYLIEQLEVLSFSKARPLLGEQIYFNNLTLLDQDGDADMDIVTGGAEVYYMENSGDGLLADPVLISSLIGANTMAAINIGNDYSIDFVYFNYNKLFFCENTDRKINRISGTLFYDKNSNCVFDEGDQPAAGIMVKTSPGVGFGITDNNGDYHIGVDTGNYTVEALFNIEEAKLISYCNTAREIQIVQPGSEVTGIDFGAVILQCPELNVNVSSSRRRRCFTANTYVSWRNNGDAPAENVKVRLVYPEYVKVLQAPLPYTSEGDSIFIFDVGTVAAGEKGSLNLTDSVVCGIEDIRGLTQCTKAYISTSSSCAQEYVPEGWDKSSIAVTGFCDQAAHEVVFHIKNGDDSGNMTDSSSYRIYYNDTLVYTAKFKLTAGETLPVRVPAYGQTVRLEADQHPLHPGRSRPREIIEACGSSLSLARKGFVVTVPQDDIDHDVDISCMEITDSYDPNDKLAEPAGFGDDNYILPGERIEYTIRFQNTGTDTAYKVVIVDTLFARYDISTLKILGASHPYNVSVSGTEQPVLRWVFNNIMLPDSTTNEPASNGYVKFAIRSEEELPEGELLENYADIFFDYNSAIRTNTYSHEINYFIPEDLSLGTGINEGEIITGISVYDKSVAVSVYPNPFSENLTFSVPSKQAYSIYLLTAGGEEIKAITNISSSTYKLNKGELKAGVYLFKIVSADQGLIAAGKVVVVE